MLFSFLPLCIKKNMHPACNYITSWEGGSLHHYVYVKMVSNSKYLAYHTETVGRNSWHITINTENKTMTMQKIILYWEISSSYCIDGQRYLPTLRQNTQKFSPELWYFSPQVQRYNYVTKRTRKSTKYQNLLSSQG